MESLLLTDFTRQKLGSDLPCLQPMDAIHPICNRDPQAAPRPR